MERHFMNIRPKWVLVDGKLHNVSEYAKLKPNNRPLAQCPVCNLNVILKLGEKRTHHYAHLSDVICASTQPETAQHLNAKYYLYSQLSIIHSVLIEKKCSKLCGTVTYEPWLQDWDEVIVEHSLGSYRPDITLLSKGQAIGAIEVLVSHKVTGEKERYFIESGISCIEVFATQVFDEERDKKWDPKSPLPRYRHIPSLGDWVCDSCKKKEKKSQITIPSPQQLRLGSPVKDDVVILESKMVDYYFPVGKKLREIYFLSVNQVDGKSVSALVKTESTSLGFEEGPIDDDALQRLRKIVENRVHDLTPDAMVTDVAVDWEAWLPGKKFDAREVDNYPFRYSWDENQDIWNKLIIEIPDKINEVETTELIIQDKERVLTYKKKIGICKYCGKSIDEDGWIYHIGIIDEVVCRNADCIKKMNDDIDKKNKFKIWKY